MIIIYITASLPYGPAEPFTVAEIEGLRRLGHRVTLIPMRPNGNAIHVPTGWRTDVITEKLMSFGIVWAAVKMLGASASKLFRVMALIAQSRSLGTLAKNALVLPKAIWLAEIARGLKADHIHANWASCPATIGLIASELSGIPWSFTGHRVDIQGNNLLTVKAERARFVRFISESGRDLAKSAGSLVAAQRANVVHMGVALPALSNPGVEQNERNRAQVVLCVANLVALKAHVDLLRAFRILQDRSIHCELWLAGDGPLRHSLETLVDSLDLAESVKFLGQLPHNEVIDLYRSQAITCAVLASLVEGIPVSLMEAMSYGVPVVATDVGGMRELLGGGCGVIVPPRNPEALADGIARILTDHNDRRNFATAGRKRIECEYAVDKNVVALSALFENASVGAVVA